jgi:hypothetical protein
MWGCETDIRAYKNKNPPFRNFKHCGDEECFGLLLCVSGCVGVCVLYVDIHCLCVTGSELCEVFCYTNIRAYRESVCEKII